MYYRFYFILYYVLILPLLHLLLSALMFHCADLHIKKPAPAGLHSKICRLRAANQPGSYANILCYKRFLLSTSALRVFPFQIRHQIRHRTAHHTPAGRLDDAGVGFCRFAAHRHPSTSALFVMMFRISRSVSFMPTLPI